MVQPVPKLGLQRLELRPIPLLHRQSDHLEVAIPRLPTRVGKPEKVEGVRFALAPPLPILGRKASELDQVGLAGVKLEPKLCDSLAWVPRSALLHCIMGATDHNLTTYSGQNGCH